MTPQQLYREKYPERVRASNARYRERMKNEDPDRQWRHHKAFRERNPEAGAKASALWRARHPEQYLLRSAKHRARKKGIEFTITLADIEIPETCPALGIPLVRNQGKLKDNSPTLDRFDNSLGYVPGNVRVISSRANRIKTDATAEELRAVALYAESTER